MSGFKTVAYGLRYCARAAARWIRRHAGSTAEGGVGEPDPYGFTYRALIASLERRGARMFVAAGRHEHAYRALELEGLIADSAQRPAFKLHRFDHRDHNLRSVSDQRVVHALLDELIGDW